MKKEVIHFVQYVLVKILFFGAAYPLQAQVSNPSSWESFVGSDENRLISDTLRLQTFGDSEWDNWGYTLTVNSSPRETYDKDTCRFRNHFFPLLA